MRALWRSPFLRLTSCVVGWLIAALIRRRALMSIGRAQDALSRSA